LDAKAADAAEGDKITISPSDKNTFVGGGPLKLGDEFEFEMNKDRRILAVQRIDECGNAIIEHSCETPAKIIGRIIPDFVSVNTTQLVHALVVCVQSLCRMKQ
jgi:hypothetical protein